MSQPHRLLNKSGCSLLSMMSRTNKKRALLLLERSVNTPRFSSSKQERRLGDIERFKIRNGDDRSLIIVEHAWCLVSTVGLGYRNVSLSGHPVSVFSVRPGLLIKYPSPRSDCLSTVQCFDRSGQVNNNSIVSCEL